MTKRIARYEQIIIDNNFKRAVVRFKVLIAGLFSHFLANNAAARCEVSARTRDQKHLFDDKIAAKQNAYAMVNLDNNGPIDGNAGVLRIAGQGQGIHRQPGQAHALASPSKRTSCGRTRCRRRRDDKHQPTSR